MQNSFLSKLKQLGLMLWQPRAVCNPLQTSTNIRCLVLLDGDQTANQKILTGMLAVLELEGSALQLETIHSHDQNFIQQIIHQWQPEYVLQLGMELPLIADKICMRTFSPNYVAANPTVKRQAYNTLLTLRAMLHGAT